MSSFTSTQPSGGRDFRQAIEICLQNYVGFEGRAPRSEYWFWVLGIVIAGFVLGIVFGLIDAILGIHLLTKLVLGLFELAVLLPSLAVAVRRLHDVDRSGWWILLPAAPALLSLLMRLAHIPGAGLFSLIYLVCAIVLIVWYCTKGTTGQNRFGPDPLGGL